MSSSSLKSFLRSREQLVHLSRPLVEVDAPRACPPGFRPSKWSKQSEGLTTKRLEPWKRGHGVTRTGQRAAKDWTRSESLRMREFLKEHGLPRKTPRASFHHVKAEGDQPAFWFLGVFLGDQTKPAEIHKGTTIAQAMEDLNLSPVVYVFQDKDLGVEDFENYPTPRFTVSPPKED